MPRGASAIWATSQIQPSRVQKCLVPWTQSSSRVSSAENVRSAWPFTETVSKRVASAFQSSGTGR